MLGVTDSAGYWGYLTTLWEVQHSRHRCTTLLQMPFPEDEILSESYCHFEQCETAMVFVYKVDNGLNRLGERGGVFLLVAGCCFIVSPKV